MSYSNLVGYMEARVKNSTELSGDTPLQAYRGGYAEAKRQAINIAAEADGCISDFKKEIDLLIEKLKLATDALEMIAKYAPTRPAAELGLAPEADARWAQQAGSMAKKTLEEIAKKDSEAKNE